MEGLHRKDANCTESITTYVPWFKAQYQRETPFLILVCLGTLSPVCEATTSFHLLKQKDLILFVFQHARNWETESLRPEQ